MFVIIFRSDNLLNATPMMRRSRSLVPGAVWWSPFTALCGRVRLVSAAHPPLPSISASVRAILAPSSTFNTAKGRLEAVGPFLKQIVASGDDACLQPMVVLELLRLMVDNLEEGALEWLLHSNSALATLSSESSTSSPTSGNTGEVVMRSRCILRSLVVGFLDKSQTEPQLVGRFQNIVSAHVFRLVIGGPLLCQIMSASTEGSDASLVSDVAKLIVSVCSAWGDLVVAAGSAPQLPVLKYRPPRVTALLVSCSWASRHAHRDHCEVQECEIFCLLSRMIMRSAYIVAATADVSVEGHSSAISDSLAQMALTPVILASYGWSQGGLDAAAVARQLDDAAMYHILGNHFLFPEQSSMASPQFELASIHDTTVATSVVVNDDVRMRQVLLQLARRNANNEEDHHNATRVPIVVVDLLVTHRPAVTTDDLNPPAPESASYFGGGIDTFLGCLLPLKSWLDLLAAADATKTTPSHRSVSLSFQFVSSVLILCVVELRRLMAEDVKRLLDQKPRVHLLKDAAELMHRVGLKSLFPEIACAGNDSIVLKEAQRVTRAISHTAAFLVRKVLSLKGASLKEVGTIGALLTGGVDHNHIKQDSMLRNAAYRVMEPLLARWYRVVDPGATLSWGFRSRTLGGRVGDGDVLGVVQEFHHHLDLGGALVSASEGMCLRHPMQQSFVTLLEMWRVVCVRATVITTMLAGSGPAGWSGALSWLESDVAPRWRELWSSSNLLRCVEMLSSSLDALLQRIDEETPGGDGAPLRLPANLILSLGMLLVSTARALSTRASELGYTNTARQALLELGETCSRRARLHPEALMEQQLRDVESSCENTEEGNDTVMALPGSGQASNSTMDLWWWSEKHGISLNTTRSLQRELLQMPPPPQQQQQRVNDAGSDGSSSSSVILAGTLDCLLGACATRFSQGSTCPVAVFACWSQWASSCCPLRLYDEDKSAAQSRDAFEFGASKLIGAARMHESVLVNDGADEDDDDSVSRLSGEMPLPLRSWSLQRVGLCDELMLCLV